ncbi:hypothetical protein [Pseudomonas syringae]|uniref:hypothetical protein n=1 Tax=Pseudomonas syringae TaxID=317 RepID=UPI0013728F9A|nr:hypothetical protein [Pseudomonas syringae]NAO53356.1 hypothetical protein [Pseudomonas syringae]
MNSSIQLAHEKKIESLVKDYSQQGFTVMKEPAAESIPFDLGGYRPDLLATKGDLKLIIEVKTKASRISIDKFQSLAQEISKHDGWRFLLVTLEDIDSSSAPTGEYELPTWPQLESKLLQIHPLIKERLIEPATLYLWSIFEAALRKRAIDQSIPVERLPPSILIKHMYSQGEVSVNDMNMLLEFMNKRNRLAHGANEKIDPEQLSILLQTVSRILAEWTNQHSG